uniref:Uncharacterized protein n=1 Tax=Anopheles minimus TaxID=112268 RepID=A0A182W8I8_9DIPT
MELNQLAPAIAAEKRKRRNAERCWTTDLLLEREDIWNRLFQAIDGEGPNNKFNSFLRVTRAEFNYLLEKIGPQISKQDTAMRKAITAKQRLCIALRFLASGDSFESLAFLFRIHIADRKRSLLTNNL